MKYPCIKPINLRFKHCNLLCLYEAHFTLHHLRPLLNLFFSSKYILQSVRGHSAIVLTATINGMQEIHPVIYLLFKLSHNCLIFGSSLTRFLYHTQGRTTVGRTPLDEWSVCRRDLYLTTHNTHNRHTCPRWDSNPRSQQARGRRPTPVF
jgi:hypothetical protein